MVLQMGYGVLQMDGLWCCRWMGYGAADGWAMVLQMDGLWCCRWMGYGAADGWAMVGHGATDVP
jgi:coenzyme F420-reducing hydrogenase delta subunit